MHVRWNDADKPAVIKTVAERVDREGKPDGRKEKGAQSDLYQAILPIYYLGKLCGLLPARFAEQTTGRFQVRLYCVDILYSIGLLILLLAAEVCGMWRDMKDGWENSTRLKSRTAVIATCSDVVGIMILTSVCIIGSAFRWRQIQIVMNKLIDKTRRFTVALTVCSLTYLLVNSIIDIYAWDRETKNLKKMIDKGPINYSPLYVMYAVILAAEIQYGVATYNIGQRFLRLNKTLENILKSGRITDHFKKDLGLAGNLRDQGTIVVQRQDPGSIRGARRTKTFEWCPLLSEGKTYSDSISDLVTVHSSLCDTIDYINNAYGVTVLVIILTCLLHLIIAPYFLILQVEGNHEWLFLIVQGMWCIFHLTRMLLIVQPAYSTVTEGKRTAVLVSQLLAASHGLEARKELEIFSLQLLHRPLEFSACGLFSLDRALITSVAGAVTTYLVILIQFQNADDTKGEADMIRNATQLLIKNVTSLQNLTGFKQSRDS